MSGYNEAFDFEHHKKEFESLIRHLTQKRIVKNVEEQLRLFKGVKSA